MNIGEFIIKIGTQGDTKELEKAIKKLEEAEKKTRRQIKVTQDLAKATSDEERALIKKNAAQQDELEGLKKVEQEKRKSNESIAKNINSTLKWITAIGATVTMLDRLGNSLLKANQSYITFERQTGMSITRLNQMVGVAKLSGANLSAEQVAGDLSSLQRQIFRFQRFGENAGMWSSLGIIPSGDSDNMIKGLRTALKNRPAQVQAEYLAQMGLSQEWLNIIALSDEQFKDFLKTSKKLQLTEKERKQLAKYNYIQQKNNMRWELAKQKLLIAVMPLVQKIMEVTSKVALQIANILDKKPVWLQLVKDILILLAGNKIIRAIEGLAALLGGGGLIKGLGRGAGRIGAGRIGAGILGGLGLGAAAKTVGKWAGAKAGLGIVGKTPTPLGIAANIALIAWTLSDLSGFIKNKDNQEEDPFPEPVEPETRYSYQNVKTNMTNNFFNNPQPTQTIINEFRAASDRYLAARYI